jgi:hypothetical protein
MESPRCDPPGWPMLPVRGGAARADRAAGPANRAGGKGGKGNALWQLHALNKPDKHRLQLAAGAYYRSVDVGSVMRSAVKATPDWNGPLDIPSVFLRPQNVLLPLEARRPTLHRVHGP